MNTVTRTTNTPQARRRTPIQRLLRRLPLTGRAIGDAYLNGYLDGLRDYPRIGTSTPAGTR